MAFKTMLRQLISRWGILSIDLQRAMEQDNFAPESDYLTVSEAPASLDEPDPAPEEPTAEPDVEAVSLDDL